MKFFTTTLGRVLYAAPFAVFGFFNLVMGGQMAGLVPSWLPGGVVWVYATGIALIAAAVSFVTTIQMQRAAFGLALFLLVTVVLVHLPGLGNEATRQMAMIGGLKDLSLLGAALTFAGASEK